MSFDIKFRETIDPFWLSVPRTVVGKKSLSYRTPDIYVTLADNDNPLLRVDIYADSYICFQEALIWNNSLCIGYGEQVYLISLSTQIVTTIECRGYFGHLYHNSDYLLIASAENLICIDSNSELLWESEKIGIDGVVVHHFDENTVYAEGQYDPPNGWDEFKIDAHTGAKILPKEMTAKIRQRKRKSWWKFWECDQ